MNSVIACSLSMEGVFFADRACVDRGHLTSVIAQRMGCADQALLSMAWTVAELQRELVADPSDSLKK
ncbi:hypothetical protein [Paraburkholderia jirisanensis]